VRPPFGMRRRLEFIVESDHNWCAAKACRKWRVENGV
jgi:hypothetical protein